MNTDKSQQVQPAPDDHVHGPDCDHDHGDHEHYLATGETYRRETPKVGRNDACPCGSGKKYKKCHGQAG